MDKLRIGLIGTGHWARSVHGPSVLAHAHTELVGVWGRDQARTRAVAKELHTNPHSELETLLAQVEALTFAVPPDVQAPIAARAAELGLHLLLEKPIALSAADAVRLERAVDEAGVASVVFFTRRFLPDVQEWLRHASETGGWYSGRAEADFNLFGEDDSFAVSPWRREHGALWDMGPHSLALLIPILGDITAVSAVAGRGDQVHLILRHGQGSSSTSSFSYTSPAANGNSLYVDGSAGRSAAPMPALATADSIAAHGAALDALIDQVQQAKPSHPCDVHLGARVVEVLAAAQASLASGCIVEVNKTPAGR